MAEVKKKKRNSIEVDDEAIELIRERAKKIGITQGAYVKLCVIASSSDIRLK